MSCAPSCGNKGLGKDERTMSNPSTVCRTPPFGEFQGCRLSLTASLGVAGPLCRTTVESLNLLPRHCHVARRSLAADYPFLSSEITRHPASLLPYPRSLLSARHELSHAPLVLAGFRDSPQFGCVAAGFEPPLAPDWNRVRVARAGGFPTPPAPENGPLDV